MAGTSLPSSLLSQGPSLLFSSSNQVSEAKCRTVVTSGKRSLVRCLAKKKISFVDQILDYIEGGPKLRKWYGAPVLLPKDGSSSGDDEEIEGILKTKCKKLPKRVELESQDLLHFSCLRLSTSFGTYEPEEEDDRDGDKDAVFVTDGDSDLGQMIILQLIVKGTRVKALVKDKRKALEAFGAYVELTSGDASDERFLRKAFKGVGAIISPTEGFLSNVKSLKGVKHAVLLSQVRMHLHEFDFVPIRRLLALSALFLAKLGVETAFWHVLYTRDHGLMKLQLSVYESSGGIQAMMNNKAKKLAEEDENAVISSNVPYTIIRTGKLENSPGGNQGFSFSAGAAAKGSISKEDAARICIEALSVIPPTGFIFEVSNGEEAVSDWEGQLMKLMQRESQKK